MNKSSQHLERYLKDLTKAINKQNSLYHKFITGVVAGVGTAIGATIVASIVVLILSQLIKSVEDVPILNSIIQSIQLEQILETRK